MLRFISLLVSLVIISACGNNSKEPSTLPLTDAPARKDTAAGKAVPGMRTALPELPAYVAFKDWEIGDPGKAKMVVDIYKAWDGPMMGDIASSFTDSAVYDFPDGSHWITTHKTIESTFREWRHHYKETSNIPFSMISLHNNERNQDWVIAWTWNKWRNSNGTKDSMLFCDNWLFKEGKVTYLNSMQNQPSKSLARRLNEIISK